MMFSLSMSVQPQVTLPLSHLINILHPLKNSVGSSSSATCKSRKQKEHAPDADLHRTEFALSAGNLRELGLSDLGKQQLDELVSQVLPRLSPQEAPPPAWGQSPWRTSHLSSHSFFHNKHGFLLGTLPLMSPVYLNKRPSPLQTICTELKHWPAMFQSRGFKTLRTKTRRVQSAFERPADSETFAPSFIKGLLTRDKGLDAEGLDGLLRNKNVPDGQQEAFKRGFAEGFLKAQALTQRTQDSLRRTRLFLLVLLLVGLYGISKTPFISGVLLVGPPGTGKTLLARAVAGEADVPFYYASGSEFDEMFVGVGASRIRNLFREAKGNAPCVIFIDELDSVGGKRIESPMHPYSRQTINQLLAEMDGFKPNEGVIIIGATNFPEALDNALIRPGRFDMQVTVPKPDVKGRTEILNWYLKKIKVDPAIEANVIARGTVGFSGADLENLVNQAALKAAVDGKDMVTMKELEFAKDKILMGPERRSAEIDQKNKLITAYHESGHAIVAYYTKDAMPINKATIMPRGPSLGHVSMLPENDRWSETRSQLLAQMDVSMGGRVAEEIIFGHENITTGASNDFDGATRIAKMMVTRYGMCEKLGVMTYSDLTAQSPETQAAVEQEVRVLLKDSYERAKSLLKSHAKEHKNLADALLMYETLDAKEIQLVLEGKTLETR
uniref:ATP-dependent zinc metalloprotease YME1L1 n=1 Tax=Poecilia reticulata TaxID=8081 RepID=A0A3P9N356_POERE